MAYSQSDLLSKISASQRSAFQAKAQSIADGLGVPLYHLLAIMDVESGMNPAIENAYGYVGLIQFGPSAASMIGTTTSALKNMDAVTQLSYVQKYFSQTLKNEGLSKVSTFADLYLLVLWPNGVKNTSTSTPVMPKTTADRQADILKDSTGNITKDSITAGYASRYAGLLEATVLFAKKNWIYLAVGALLVIIAGFLIYSEFIAKKSLLQFPKGNILD